MIFRNWVLQNFPFLEDDFDALTDYELFCKMVEYMKKSLEKIALYDEKLINFNERLTELENYVDNLDIQDAVNNKLDEMAESGQLADIIAQYLGLAGVLAFNVVSDLENAENVVNGSIARVLGKEAYNDGLGCYYKIRNILNTDVIDGDNIIGIVNDPTLVGEKIIPQVALKTKYITPEMFGAIGDGVNDDSEALLDMIDYIDDLVPVESSDYANKDWSYVSIKFNGIYAISQPITITNSYNARIDNLQLIATDDFTGDYLLGFTGGSRNVTIINSVLNGKLVANKCLFIDDYTLVFRIDNCQLTRFKEHGLYANDDQGHEIMMSKTKVNQVEWAERNDLGDLVSTGVGVYLGNDRHDNLFSDNVINYCKDYSLVVKSGSNMFNNMHFYWTDVRIEGFHNHIQNSYFDGTKLETMGDNAYDNNYFGSDDGEPFIKILETYSNNWRCYRLRLTNNTFENKGTPASISNSIEFDSDTWDTHTGDFKCECIANLFTDCPKLEYSSPYNNYPEPWKKNIWTGTNAYGGNGSVRIGDLLIQYGTISTAGSVNFPITYTLAPFIVAIDHHGAQSSMPMANNISVNGFYANGVTTTSTWYAIGRMNT